MARRMLLVFFVFCVLIGLISVQLLFVPVDHPVQRSLGTVSIAIAESRGAIYDRNGKRLVHQTAQTAAVVKPTDAALESLRGVLAADKLNSAKERAQKGALFSIPIDTDQIQCGDILLLNTYPRYASKQLAVHLIGYLESPAGKGVSGLEKSFDQLLTEAGGTLRVRAQADSAGRVFAGSALTVEDEDYCGAAGIMLTIDAKMQELVEEAMLDSNLTQGAVVVLDVKTGEIMSMASLPAFDPNNVASSLHDPLEPFINRALLAYPVGSTFKCFVIAAALEQNVPTTQCYTCNGALDVNGRLFHCNNKNGHGTLDMSGALEQSCNLYFVQLMQRLELQPALDFFALFGFGEPNTLAPDLRGAKGNLPGLADLFQPAARANLSFGQGALLATPLQLAAATAALASGGIYHTPTLVKSVLNAGGSETEYVQDTETRQVISEKTADIVAEMMIRTVEQGTGYSAKPAYGSAGGKTATAQSGSYDSSGNEILQTGFTGFFPARNPRYVITVLRQNGVSGSQDCGPVFQKIADMLLARGF
jgi:penicillin-binding protein 2